MDIKKTLLIATTAASLSFNTFAEIGIGVGTHLGFNAVDENWSDDDIGINASLLYNMPQRGFAKVTSDFSDYHSISAGFSIPLQTFIGSASFGIGAGYIDYDYSDDNWLVTFMFSSNQVYKNIGQGGAIDLNTDTISIQYFITFM